MSGRFPTFVLRFEPLEGRTLFSAAADITGLTALRADANYAGVDGSGVGVAVIDTGVFAGHPDLSGNFVAYFDAVTSPATSAGTTDPAAAFDPNGHGTHVAGTIASTNPEVGVATAADLVAIRGLPSAGDATPQFNTVSNALAWVINNHQRYNIRVVNMSLGDYTTNFNTLPGGARPAVFDELERLGITTVIASGNNYANFATPGSASPAVFGTLSVANTWPDAGQGESFPQLGGNGNRIDYVAVETDAAPDRLAATSQRSALPNQVAAPGSGITSTWNDPAKPYNTLSGTSMASPFVAGTVALMQDAAFTYGGRYLSTAEIQSIVTTSADTILDSAVASNYRIPVGFDESGRPFREGPDQDLPETGLSFKRVNVYKAVQAVRAAVTGTTIDPDPDPVPVPGDEGDTNNTAAAAVVVPSLDATARFAFDGSIGTDGSVQTGANDVDLFRVELESPGVLTVQSAQPAGGAAFDPYVRLFDANGVPLDAVDTTAESPYPTLLTGRLPAGTYYVGVSSVANINYDPTTGGGAADGQSAGDYTLAFSLANPDPNGVAQGAADVDLTSPDRISPNNVPATYFLGEINSDPDPLNPGARITIGDTDVDMFRVVAPDNGILTVDIDALDSAHPEAGVDSYLRVFDATLTQIAAHDDEETGVLTDSYLEVPLVEGAVYYVAVTTFGNRDFNPLDPFDRTSTTPGAVGLYDLYLSFDNGDADGTVFEATPAVVGEALPGVIGTDGIDPDFITIGGTNGGVRDVDFYEFFTEDGSAGLLDVSAASPDATLAPVLTLWQFDPTENDVVKILDTAGGDARIIVPLDPGETLFVSVTGVGNNDFNWSARASGSGGDTGNYTLNSRLRPSGELETLTDNAVRGGTPTAVAPGERIYRTLGVDGGVAVGAADVDLYRFAPNASGTFFIRAIVPGEETTDPVLRVFDESGRELAFNDDAGADTTGAAVSFQAAPGQTYYIGVNGSSAEARAYDPVTGAGAAAGDAGDYVLDVSNAVVTFGGRTRAAYTDASGDPVVITLKGPGTGTVRFPEGVTGNADAIGITLDGTTAATSVTIAARGGGTPTGDVTVNGSLKSLTGKTADLTGDLTATGSVGKLALRNAGGGTITYAAAGAPTTFAFAAVSDLSLNSASPIKSLKATRWLDTDAAPDVITTSAISALTTSGEFAANVLAGSLARARFGALTGSDLRADTIGTVTAGSASDSRVFAGVRPDLSTLPASAADFSNTGATLTAFSVRGAFSNTLIAAPTIGRATLGRATTANNATPFGVAADTIRSLAAITPTERLRLARAEQPDASVAEEDFVVRVF